MNLPKKESTHTNVQISSYYEKRELFDCMTKLVDWYETLKVIVANKYTLQ